MSTVALSITVAPLTLEAQSPAKVARIGYLSSFSAAADSPNMDVIGASPTSAIRAIAQATQTIPIVMAVRDPGEIDHAFSAVRETESVIQILR